MTCDKCNKETEGPFFVVSCYQNEHERSHGFCCLPSKQYCLNCSTPTTAELTILINQGAKVPVSEILKRKSLPVKVEFNDAIWEIIEVSDGWGLAVMAGNDYITALPLNWKCRLA